MTTLKGAHVPVGVAPAPLGGIPRPYLVLGVAGMVVFALGWWVLAQLAASLFWGGLFISDVPVYIDYGDRITGGLLPYRDWALEYPPIAIPAFLLPALLTPGIKDPDQFAPIFETLMLLCGLAAAGFMALTLRSLAATPLRMAAAFAFTGLSLVLLGPVTMSHFDLWPAALLAAGIAAAVSGHYRLAGVALAFAAMAKVYPVVLVPLLIAHAWRHRDRREAVIVAFITGVTMLLILAPFAVLAPSGIGDALVRQATRPLQVESLGAAIFFLFHDLFGQPLVIESSAGSQNLGGSIPTLFATLETLLLGVALVAIWAWFARRRRTNEQFVRAGVASVVAYIAFGKVLSPQYLIWLIPLVPLVGGRRGVLAALVVGAAYLLTAAYFPSRYFDLVDRGDLSVARLILFRDLALVALLAVLALPLRRIWSFSAGTYQAVRLRIPWAAIRAHPEQVLVLVLVGAFVLRAIWLTLPQGSLIFDEAYYVNAARVINGYPVPAGMAYADAPAGIDPNTEHPPLGKVLIALSMQLFGDNGFGWRIPSLIAGMITLLALYGIVRATGERKWLGVLAVSILALDNLTLVHSRIGVLDMLALAPILVGAWLALRRRYALAGVAFAIGALVKVTAGFAFLAFLIWEGLILYRRHKAGERIALPALRPILVTAGTYVAVGLAGLAALDLRYTSFKSPIDHIRQIFGYGINLRGGPGPGGIASNPWDWLVNGGRFDYLRVDVQVLANDQVVQAYPTVQFQAALNPVLLGALPIVALFGLWLAARRGHRLATWSVIWFGANYLPFYLLVVFANRITYFFYILPAVPAMAALSAIFLLRARMPRLVTYGYLALLVLAAIAYFPFRQIPS